MPYLSQTDCCTMLGIDTQTLHHWCSSAHIQFRPDPLDARLPCLTLEQVHLLAQTHGLFPSTSATKLPPFVYEQPTVAASFDGQLRRPCVIRPNQKCRAGRKIVKHILFVRQ